MYTKWQLFFLLNGLVFTSALSAPPLSVSHDSKSPQMVGEPAHTDRPVVVASVSHDEAQLEEFLKALRDSRFPSHHLLAQLISSEDHYKKQVSHIIAGTPQFEDRVEKLESSLFVTKCPFKKDPAAKPAMIAVDGRDIGVTGVGFWRYADALELSSQELTEKRILDVGAGFSSFTDMVREYFKSQAYAIDLSYSSKTPVDVNGAPLSAECRRLFDRYHFAMDAQNIRFPDNFFDLVVSNKFFYFFFVGFDASKQHVDTGFRILEEMVRTTAVGGEIRSSDIPSPEKVKSDLKNFPRDKAREKEVDEAANHYEKRMGEFLKKYEGVISLEFPSEKGIGMTRIKKLKQTTHQNNDPTK